MKLKNSGLVLTLAVALAWLFLMLVAIVMLFYRREPPGITSVLGIIVGITLLLLLFRNLLVSSRPHPSIRRYYTISLEASDIKARADREQPFSLELGKQNVEVRVKPTKIFDDQCEIIELVRNQERRNRVEDIITYSGQATAEESSEVRLTITENILTGYVRLEADWWFIEPLRKYRLNASSQDYIVYRTKDLRFRLPYGDDVRPKKVEHQNDTGANPPHRVNPIVGIAVLADRDYNNAANITGLSWDQQQAALINNVNGIYQRSLGCELSVRWFILDLRVDSLNTTSADQLLLQMENPINLVLGNLSELSVRQRSGVEVSHLTTGKNLNGDTLGIAWQPGVYGLSQQQLYWIGGGGLFGGAPNLSFQNMMVAAHEIGHNFNGEHNDADEWCVTHFIWCWDYVRTIMWPFFYDDNRDFFSDGSRNTGHNNRQRIQNDMATGRNRNF